MLFCLSFLYVLIEAFCRKFGIFCQSIASGIFCFLGKDEECLKSHKGKHLPQADQPEEYIEYFEDSAKG